MAQDAELWKNYLYDLEKDAPRPHRVTGKHGLTHPQYGPEYHGAISRDTANALVRRSGEGAYLVRESERQPGCFTLVMMFSGEVKNFKLFFDFESKAHYVGEKKFESVEDLVADGLITMYVDSMASDYIARMDREPIYDRLALKPAKPTLLDIPTEYTKSHNFKVSSFKGPHWCQFCGNYLWGLVAQGLKCQDCGLYVHKQCSKNVPSDCKPLVKKVKNIFGADLTTLAMTYDTMIPFVVDRLIDEVEHRGLQDEGIYRISGFSDDIELVKEQFEKERTNARLDYTFFNDVHSLAGALKLYLRQLPIPVITFDAYQPLINAMNSSYPEAQRVESVRQTMRSMPPCHVLTLRRILRHLEEVTKLVAHNKMDAENLSVVFGPTLMRSPKSDQLSNLLELPTQRSAVSFMIAHCETIFC